jgi:hypothetical protein
MLARLRFRSLGMRAGCRKGGLYYFVLARLWPLMRRSRPRLVLLCHEFARRVIR